MDDIVVSIAQRAFKSLVITYHISIPEFQGDTDNFMNGIKEKVFDLVNRKMDEYGGAVKVQFVLLSEFYSDSVRATKDAIFNTKMRPIHSHYEFEDVYESNVETLLKKLSEFNNHGSDWVFMKVLRLELHINKYNPLRGGEMTCY